MKVKYQKIIVILITFFLFIGVIPNALAKTRSGYLISFILDNEIEGQGFKNSLKYTGEISFEATAYAIDILDFYGRNPNDIDTLKDNLENNIKNMIDDNVVDLYILYYLLKSLKILESDYLIETTYFNKIYKYVNDTEQLSGGFSYSNSSTLVSLSSTYYVFQIYSLIEKPVENLEIHKNWVLLCNNSDGGYGGNSTLSSTLLDTYFALLLLDEIGEDINNLINLNTTLNYIKSFYVDEEADINNYGGYLPDGITIYALLSSTYFSVKLLDMIEPNELNSAPTIKWILARQNFQDGGFADNSEGFEQKSSSVVTTYFALETLKILNPSLSSLSKEIWMVEFNFWILGIIFVSIVIIIAIIIYILRKRRI